MVCWIVLYNVLESNFEAKCNDLKQTNIQDTSESNQCFQSFDKIKKTLHASYMNGKKHSYSSIQLLTLLNATYMGVSLNGGTPSHPF